MKQSKWLMLPLALLASIALFEGQANPDLTVEAISTASLSTDSQTLAISGSLQPTIRNLGAATSVPFTVQVFEDRNGNRTFEAGTDLQLGTAVISSLAAGASTSPVIPVSGTILFAGNILYVRADSGNAILEPNEANNIRFTGQNFTFQPAQGGLNPTLLWERKTFVLSPTKRRSTGPVAVGDIDGDGFPEIVFVASVGGIFADGILRVLDGRDGSEKVAVVDPTLELRPTAGITLGDIDNDNLGEIITLDEQCRLIVFENDGSLKWRGTETHFSSGSSCIGGAALADLDKNGSPEIIIGRSAYSATGTLLWQGTGKVGGANGPMSFAADVDGDGTLEVVAGPTVYNASGGIVFNRAELGEAYSAVGNLDADPQAEIVFKPRTGNALIALEHDGTIKWQAPWAVAGGGPPTIGNFDSDAAAEIGIAGSVEYRVYEADGTLKWANPIIDQSSGITSATLFDFDADGEVEVVFADEQFLYIWRGRDGFELFKAPRPHNTGVEMPVVVDVNSDGNAEIVVPLSGGTAATQGIQVYRGANGNWAHTRRIWNQPAYSIFHILDNLKVPASFTSNWLVEGYNNFRLNTFLPGQGQAPNSIGDFTISFLRRDDRDFPAKTSLIARIGNGGSALLPLASFRFTAGVGGATICGGTTTRLLAPGQFEDVSCEYLNPTPGAQNVVGQVDFAALIPEGDENNNSMGVNLVIGQGPAVMVSDLTVRARDRAMDVKWTPVPGAAGYNIYRRVGEGNYVLHQASYNNALGAFADTGLTNNTVYWYHVRWLNSAGVESPLGTEASAMPIPRTQRGDTAPTITSIPITQSRTGLEYRYQVAASDPDAGDVLTFELLAPPTGMVIGANSGVITWLPQANQAGSFRIQAAVRDSRNRVTSQYFPLFIETQITNNPPRFTSVPVTQATVGRSYAYTARASDPDAGELLTFSRTSGPAGLSIHPTTGLISWLPSLAQTGSYPVGIRVTDLSGLGEAQNFQVQVSNPNQQPTITSTAPTSVLLGSTYSYAPTASDPDPGDVLTWSLPVGPTGFTINSSTGAILFNPAGIGTYAFTLEVMDALGAFHRQSFAVNVSAILNQAPVFTSLAPTVAEPGQSYVYAAAGSDPDGDAVAFSLVTGPAGMMVTTAGVVRWTVPGNATGSVPVTLRIADPLGANTLQNFTITIAPVDSTAPTLSISSPAANALVSGEVSVTGTVEDPNLVNWRLEYQIMGGSQWIALNQGTANVVNGLLGVLPATMLANNPYALRLTAFDRRQGAFVQNIVRVGGDAVKLGAFTLAYTDLRLPALVMPIEIRRVYDSRKPYWNDFGTGWALGFSETDLRIDGNYNAYVTLPNGRQAIFAFLPVQTSPVFPALENRYQAPVGVGDKLENLDCPSFLGAGQNLVCLGGDTPFQAYNPRRWRLTTKEGTQFIIENSTIKRIEDRNGNWVQIATTGVSSSNGQNVTFTRDSAGRITQISDARGHRQTYAYDGAGRLIQHTDTKNQLSTFEYQPTSHLITRILQAGGCQAVRQEFDLSGRLTARIDSDGRRTEYAYDLAARRLTKTFPGGISTSETYDEGGNVLSFTDGEGQTRAFSYDTSGRRILTTLPGGRRVARTYDASGNVSSEEDGPNGGPYLLTAYEWTSGNVLSRISRPNGDYQTFSYNTAGSLLTTQIFNAGGSLAEEYTYSYDAAGRLLSENSRSGVFNYTYDATGNLTRITDGALRTQNFVYDANGNVVTAYNGGGQRYDRAWDEFGLPGNGSASGLTTRTQTWNSFGLPASVGNSLGQQYQFSYSCSGLLSEVRDPLNGRTQYERNALGRILQRRDALNQITTHTYDRNGLPLSDTSAAGDVKTQTYTADGLLAGVNRGLGNIATTYDAYGRKATEVSPSRSDTYTYDMRGRVASIVSTGNAAGTMSFTRDAADRLLSATDRFGRTVTYTYDSKGRRSSMTAPDASVTTYIYDAGGNISRITTDGRWAEYSYDLSGRRTGLIYSNGVRAAYSWNPRNQLASLTWFSPANAIIRSWNYSYDAGGRRTAATLNDGSVNWSYDSLGRLSSEIISSTLWGNRSASWTYDSVGNRLDAGAVFGSDHRLTNLGAEVISHDAAGNMTSMNASPLGYDAHNRVVSTSTNEYRYNGLGRRDQLTGTAARTYIVDGHNTLGIFSGNTFSHRYTNGLNVDELLFARNASVYRFYLTDEQGSVIATTDESGTLLHQYAYNAWGERVFNAAAVSSALGSSNYNPFEFQAKEKMNVNELYFFRARPYRAGIGRFAQKDPARGSSFLPASRHPYQFAFNRPTQFVDPSGWSATQYGLLVRENKAAEATGIIIGFLNSFGGTNLSFLGNFLDSRVKYPEESISASVQVALDSTTKDMETVLEEFEDWFTEDGASVAQGLATGVSYGIPAGTYWINYFVLGTLPF